MDLDIDAFKAYHPDLIVVIPSYNESIDNLQACISSLERQADSDLSMLVLILINYKSDDAEVIKNTSKALYNQLLSIPHFSRKGKIRYHTYLRELGGKSPGVGMARKILMDAAFRIYYKLRVNGVIVNLDADTLVSPHYTKNIVAFFADHADTEALSIAFEHPVSDAIRDPHAYAAALYELHLRYFINMQRLIQLPYAFQTVGSAMAVRAWAYAKEGGMNMRQAGEDFYFLHKYSKNGALAELNTCCVYPSTRESDRVPFGTGKAISDALSSDYLKRLTYHPAHFEMLKSWIDSVISHKNDDIAINTHLNQFLVNNKYEHKLEEIKHHTRDAVAFEKRFYQWFDPFLLMKYLHYMRDNMQADCDVNQGVRYLFDRKGWVFSTDPIDNLMVLRQNDKNA
jgi:hypothetical protein